ISDNFAVRFQNDILEAHIYCKGDSQADTQRLCQGWIRERFNASRGSNYHFPFIISSNNTNAPNLSYCHNRANIYFEKTRGGGDL
ncbi:hypothetical protein SESBI_02874, partial [Sesbania bispinosa]